MAGPAPDCAAPRPARKTGRPARAMRSAASARASGCGGIAWGTGAISLDGEASRRPSHGFEGRGECRRPPAAALRQPARRHRGGRGPWMEHGAARGKPRRMPRR